METTLSRSLNSFQIFTNNIAKEQGFLCINHEEFLSFFL